MSNRIPLDRFVCCGGAERHQPEYLLFFCDGSTGSDSIPLYSASWGPGNVIGTLPIRLMDQSSCGSFLMVHTWIKS